MTNSHFFYKFWLGYLYIKVKNKKKKKNTKNLRRHFVNVVFYLFAAQLFGGNIVNGSERCRVAILAVEQFDCIHGEYVSAVFTVISLEKKIIVNYF